MATRAGTAESRELVAEGTAARVVARVVVEEVEMVEMVVQAVRTAAAVTAAGWGTEAVKVAVVVMGTVDSSAPLRPGDKSRRFGSRTDCNAVCPGGSRMRRI